MKYRKQNNRIQIISGKTKTTQRAGKESQNDNHYNQYLLEMRGTNEL